MPIPDLELAIGTGRKRWQRGGPDVKAWVRNVLHRDPCAYCGQAGGTVDHITSVRHGGTADPSNLTGACEPCNVAKADSLLIEFLHRRAA